jgi:hypothetical protein
MYCRIIILVDQYIKKKRDYKVSKHTVVALCILVYGTYNDCYPFSVGRGYDYILLSFVL